MTAGTEWRVCALREITVKAGELVCCAVTAHRRKILESGAAQITGFTVLRGKDRTEVAGWDLLFRPGKQEILLTAPTEPGEYDVAALSFAATNMKACT